MFDLADDIAELMYVADPETYELLFMNKLGRKMFNIQGEEYRGKKCYQVLQHLNAPCPFCTNGKLSFEQPYTWEKTNPVTGRHFLLKDKKIMYEGKPARFELAFDITDFEKEKIQLKSALEAEQTVLLCVRNLNQQTNAEDAISGVLQQLGEYLEADRSYLFEVRGDKLYNTSEWCREGVTPQKENLQALDISLITRWKESFAKEQSVIIEDMESIKDVSPEEYAILKAQNIRSLVVMPLEGEKKIKSFIGVDNPPLNKVKNIASLLMTLRYYINATLKRFYDEKKLLELSFCDVLTRLFNRNCYLNDVAELKNSKQSLGIVFLDINGLKQVNDLYGHDRGDELLVECANILRREFFDADKYRIGGDEFVILQSNVSEAEFTQNVINLRTIFADQSALKVAIGSKWVSRVGDTELLLGEADAEMYADKVRFYSAKSVSPRFRYKSEKSNEAASPDSALFVDPVTGGSSRLTFRQEVESVLKDAQPNQYVLVSMDVQKFKLLNDLYGVSSGDQVLRYIHNKLSQEIHEGEFVTRLSADIYNLLLKADTRENIENRLCAMVEKINVFNEKQEHKYFLTFIAGIYYLDEPQLPLTRLQDRANFARKHNKNLGSSRHFLCSFYSDDDRLRLSREKYIENRMQDALQNKEFTVYLQPKFSLKENKIVGAEALIRWQDPEQGLIMPNEFIPLFEKNGFVLDLDFYVFETVCERLKKWELMGKLSVPISVNMSRAHLIDKNFMLPYEQIREKYDVSPSLIEFELTETMVMDSVHVFSRVVDQIHLYGYRCSMDDFGSGFSSLNVLKNFHVDTLKLDKAFIDSAGVEERETVVVDMVVSLATRLKMTTVAEGVETIEQAKFLRESGCDIIQGYLFSRPVPIPEFEKLLWQKKHKPVG